jgi:indole-3-glycerol phosphate synthase
VARRRREAKADAMTVLEEILATKRVEIDAAHARDTEAPTLRRGTLDVARMLARPPGAPLRFLAEVKYKTPIPGELSRALDAPSRAESYARAGASMISVLCDSTYFGGGWDDLARSRARVDTLSRDVPLLAKEFILDEVQLDLARTSGADAVLLIARIVSRARLAELYQAARARSLVPLVEVVTESELEAAHACGAKIIGVNARDLDTLQMDAVRAARLLEAIPAGRVAIHLSGLKSAEDVRRIAAGRADAALIGEALMRAADPAPLLHELVAAAS